MPRFPTTLNERTFKIAKDYLMARNYCGPVALACDDTKLHPALRTYWDPVAKSDYVVGHTGDPIPVANAEELRQVLDELREKKSEATKVAVNKSFFVIIFDSSIQLRLWAIQIPFPKVPPIIIAAKAILNNLNAQQLHEYSQYIIRGLLEEDIKIISYACDGTETERSVQNLIIEHAPHRITYTIQHPKEGLAPIVVTMPVYRDRTLIMVQDVKHCLKTFRNNLHSGARLLVLGNDVAMYSHSRDLAFEENSPLYHRDVEKTDRQDDNAASRLFSATTLEFLINQHPDRVGHIAYLFVFGELVDSYQNRSISHVERIKMALRAHFFLDMWLTYLKKAEYPTGRFFISREAADISRIVVNALIGLIIIHRDHMDGEVFPLFPWLHSSEMVEHIFAECRKLIKDFTYDNFLHMIPRLTAIIRATIKFGFTTDPKARASGYAHTYFDGQSSDVSRLSIFPTDSEISLAARCAWEEAENLFNLFGISTNDFMMPATNVSTPFPSISSWWTASDDPVSYVGNVDVPLQHKPDVEDSDSDMGEESDDEDTDAMAVRHIIDAEERATGRSKKVEDRMFNLTCAAIMVDVNDSMVAYVPSPTFCVFTECFGCRSEIPDLTAEEELDQAAEDSADIAGALLAAKLPGLKLPSEEMHPFDRPVATSHSCDFSALMTVRWQHGTKRAAQGVRVKSQSEESAVVDAKGEPTKSEVVKREIKREMNAVLREHHQKAVGTGLEHLARWQNS
jgi:hypothetical protein